MIGRSRSTVVLIVINLLAASALASAIRRSIPPDAEETPTIPQIRGGHAVPPPTTSPSWFPETLARPVFLSSRRPFRPPAQSVVPVLQKIKQMPAQAGWDASATLKGVVMTGSYRRAFIDGGAQAKGDWIAEGATVMGWTLKSVGLNKATLTRGDQAVDLYLYEEGRIR